ncbi:MAG: TolC family protein [Spirochaetes bacterium]|nr:TolC family protein [Spirochaetota bacterium]
MKRSAPGKLLPLLLVFSILAPAAEPLSFEKLLALSVTNNLSVRIAQRDLDNIILNLKQIDLQYVPRLTLTLDAPQISTMTDYARSNTFAQAPQFDGSLVLTEKIPSFAPKLPYHAEASVSYNLSRIQATTNGDLTNQDKWNMGLALGLTVTLWREDTSVRDRDLQKERLRLTRLSQAQVYRQFAYDLRQAYYGFCNERETVENERRRLSGDRESIEVARQKFKAGIIAEYSLIDYEVDFRRSEVRLSDSERAWGEKNWNLYYVLYRPKDSLGEIATVDESLITNLAVDPALFLAWALSNSLDLANLQFALFQNQQTLRTAELNLWPKLSVSAGVGWGSTNTVNWTNGFSGPAATRTWTGSLPANPVQNSPLGLNLSANLVAPLFTDWWITRNQLQIARNSREQLKLQIEDRVRTLGYRIRVDLLDLENQYFRFRKAQENFALLRKNFELSRQRFEVGVISSWEMITTKNAYYDNFNAFIDAKYAYLSRLAQMERDYGVKGCGL